ncbi:MAG: Cadmium, cobalt and zinc/H(+)-K(+) antiporter [Paracidovorax wautersii]|uniref:Cadmium, cobalt and zinc/H(+)-K(+) antiporter n=1 Tax=Paracidovorax wautersii TaxID=1177982 RepID=A0A7V8JPU8_9BURK|nr:MAG: Cadmium, cobalt and zinc/H(+)-K(+) antiporter [Paracidovorax wautersii]
MHTHDLARWQHSHQFDQGNPAGARGTRLVMWITAAAMLLEIGAGWWFNSMALLADGWHMSSHAVALGLSAFAYTAARRYARDPRFAFGTWKIEVLAGFASALFLIGVAVLMVAASIERLWTPAPIHYREAIAVAGLGLLVNLVCARLLSHGHGHHDHHGHAHPVGHGHAHAHGHDPAHGDLNLRSAYLHVVADAATSVLAIVALLGGWLYGWDWLDPFMGIAGAALVAWWAKGLLAQTTRVLLDREMDHPLAGEIRHDIEAAFASSHTRVADLHVWRVGREAYASALTLVTHDAALQPNDVRHRLAVHSELRHLTVEIQRCADGHSAKPPQRA